MPQMTDQYAAAALELRGRLQTNVGGARRDYRPGASVTSVDSEIIHSLRDHFGAGTISQFSPSNNPTLDLFSWNVRGPAAVEVLERLHPHMVGALRDQAEFILTREYSRPSKLEA